MKKQIIDFIKKLDAHAIFAIAVKRFITACGITLLLCFFYENMEEYTRESVARVVSCIFLLECILGIIGKIVMVIDTWTTTGTGSWQAIAMESLAAESIQKDSKNKRIITVHEAGHAVMAYLKNAEKFDIDIANNCVHTAYNLPDIAECRNCIMVNYAGAASEELIFGHFCSGCFGSGTADFESATELIKGYIVMTDATVSKTMLAEEIGQKVIKLSNDLYAETLELLTPHKEMIQLLADILLTKDYLETKEVREILSKFSPQH